MNYEKIILFFAFCFFIICCDNGKVISEKDLTSGVWGASFDVSSAQDEVLKALMPEATIKYRFDKKGCGSRNLTVFGREIKSTLKWILKSDTLFVKYHVLNNKNSDKYLILDKTKMQLLKTHSCVVTYLIKQQNN
jgi:hypothetical protein